jgi:hypothetical protein
MKLKRVKHQSYILCHMFCGWQLYPDWQRLAQLGKGILEIDVLNNRCTFNLKEIPQLSISSALRHWLLQDLEANKIPLKNIESARLTVQLGAGFDKRAGGVLNYNHEFLLEGVIVGNGKEYRTKLEHKDGRQRIVET